MTYHTLFVCILCQTSRTERTEGVSAGEHLFDQLKVELASHEWSEPIQLQPVRCMGACDRSCMAAFAAPGKLTFILSQLAATHSVSDLLQFARQYIACSDGKVPYKERPDAVKKGIHAVLPALPLATPSLHTPRSHE